MKVDSSCTMHSKERTSSGPKSDSCDELDIGAARQVYYQEHGKVPGLYVLRVAPDLVCRGFPAASPASSRTRDRIKD